MTPYFTENIQVQLTLSELGNVIEVIRHEMEKVTESNEVPEGLRRLYLQEMGDIHKRLNDQYNIAFKEQAQARAEVASK
ncbi:hypothetical protein GCM10007416_31550 [Kroppenstedtia guangzhouensis]|uniref:Phage protein n=1 Tax=Kroppenstedtia guangzhouensis TaxID=1274356 RepID=A0ABQ1H228_9BACL|nr:hypothetical protein [Kroppenstedtia guangzhouensis]GGA56073.1 hypothetical protein GCM10007416_31550 [Kroppenstedtia guangzhouensis]